MRYSDLLSEKMLNEMIVRHNDENGDFLVAFKDSIWIVDFDDFQSGEEPWDDFLKAVGEPEDTSFDTISDSRPDVLMGFYNNIDNSLDMFGGPREEKIHPVTSTLIRKVVRQLDIETVNNQSTSDYGEPTYFDSSEIRGKLPKFGYHGTSLLRLREILKKGIMPQNMGNWDAIHTENAIFFSVDNEIPKFHASRTAQKDLDIPVIIKFEIPDESRIFADYDVTANIYGGSSPYIDKAYQGSRTMTPNTYDDITQKHKRPQNLWKNTGVFGYKGRIPPSFFTEFYTTSSAPSVDNEDTYYSLDREKMNDFMKAYTYVTDEFGEIGQEFINPNWLEYTSDQIISDFNDFEDEDD